MRELLKTHRHIVEVINECIDRNAGQIKGESFSKSFSEDLNSLRRSTLIWSSFHSSFKENFQCTIDSQLALANKLIKEVGSSDLLKSRSEYSQQFIEFLKLKQQQSSNTTFAEIDWNTEPHFQTTFSLHKIIGRDDFKLLYERLYIYSIIAKNPNCSKELSPKSLLGLFECEPEFLEFFKYLNDECIAIRGALSQQLQGLVQFRTQLNELIQRWLW